MFEDIRPPIPRKEMQSPNGASVGRLFFARVYWNDGFIGRVRVMGQWSRAGRTRTREIDGESVSSVHDSFGKSTAAAS